jgi:hypothetical protein
VNWAGGLDLEAQAREVAAPRWFGSLRSRFPWRKRSDTRTPLDVSPIRERRDQRYARVGKWLNIWSVAE